MTYKKKDNTTQSYNPFLFIASVIQSKITRLTGKQDQMTEKLKGKKAKVNQQKLQISELLAIHKDEIFSPEIWNVILK